MKRYKIKVYDSPEDERLYYLKYDEEMNELYLDDCHGYKYIKVVYTEEEIRKMASKIKWLNWERLKYIEVDIDE